MRVTKIWLELKSKSFRDDYIIIEDSNSIQEFMTWYFSNKKIQPTFHLKREWFVAGVTERNINLNSHIIRDDICAVHTQGSLELKLL